MSEKRRGLGKGIGALIPTAPAGTATMTRPRDLFFEQTASSAPEPSTPGSADNTTPLASDAPAPAAPDPRADAKPGEKDAEVRETDAEVRKTDGRSAPEAPAGSTSSAEPAAGGAKDLGTADDARVTPAEDNWTALVEDRPQPAETTADEGLVPVPGATFAEVSVEAIGPNTRQPRQVFDEDELEELAGSIRQVGVLQPVVVRRTGTDPDAYELIMGERRWRAAKLAGLDTIPAIIRDVGDDGLLRDALLENLHRVQLNPLEEAAAYQQLLDDFGCTHEELATRISRSRPQISNTLRLLKLPPLVQRRVAAGVLSAGHARALLGLADGAAMERLAQRIVAEGLSVRATEEIVALGDEPTQPEMRRRPRAGAHSEVLERVASRLTDHLDTRVKVTMGQRKGRIAIEFAGIEDLDRILQALGEQPASAVQE